MIALIDEFKDNLRLHRLVRSGDIVVVAVSGGSDSMALLECWSRVAGIQEVEIVVAHANHCLRGVESDLDESFVAQAAQLRGLKFIGQRLDVRAEAERCRVSLEMAARSLRHQFLAETAIDCGARTVSVAHHADDQTELVLLRFLRGAGGDGLAGMHWSGPSSANPGIRIVRPLLNVSKARILDFLADNRIDFRDDASNLDLSIPRNRVRHQLIPALIESYSPGLHSCLARTADLVGSDAEFLNLEAVRWLEAKPRSEFTQLHVALQRAVIRRQLWGLGHVASFELVERLRLNQSPTTGIRGVLLRRLDCGEVVEVTKTETSGHLAGAVTVKMHEHAGFVEFGRWRIEWLRELPSVKAQNWRDVAGAERFDAEVVGREIRFRFWKPGDCFQPLGFDRPGKVQNLFVNRKIPQSLRYQLVVSETIDGEVFWIQSLPPGERFKVRESTRWILRLRFCDRFTAAEADY